MATKVFLGANDTFTASNNGLQVFGAAGGSEKLLIANGVTGVTTNAEIERIELAGAQASYKFAITASGILVTDGATGTVVATIPSLNQAATVAFSDGSASLVQTGGTTATLGAVALTATATVAAATLNTADKSTVSSTTTTTNGQAFTLTANATADTFALTNGNDTVTGASGTLASGDAMIDASTTDADVLTAQVTVANLAPTISKVETININGDFVTTGLDLKNVIGAQTLNFNTGITSGTATVGVAASSTGQGPSTTKVANIAFGSNVTTASINADSTGTVGAVNVNAGTLTTLTFTGGSTADSYAVTLNGNLKLAGVDTVETLKVSSSVAGKKIIFQEAYAAGKSLEIAGTSDVIFSGTAANLTARATTKTSTGAITVEVTGAGAVDTTKMAGITSVTLVAASAAAITVNSGVSLNSSVDQGAGFVITGPVATAATNANTFTNTASSLTSLNGSSVKTLTVVSAAGQVAGVDATYTTLDNGLNNVVLTGTNDVKVTLGTAASVDASGLVGFLNYTQGLGGTSAVGADTATTIKGGSGANLVTFTAATTNSTYVGKDGGDSVTLATIGASASVTTGAGNDTIIANTVTTGAASIATGGGDDTVTATGLTTGVISANLGAGNDTITVGSGATTTGVVVLAVDGGDGTDTLVINKGADFSAGTFSVSNVESIKIAGGGALTFSAAELTGKTYSFTATANVADELKVTGVAGTTSIDLSGITTDQSIASAVKLGTTINASASTSSVTIKGTGQLDTITASTTAGSTITAGGGKDAITLGGGIDKVVYVSASSTTLATESGTTVSGVGTTLATGAGDSITSFGLGVDKIVLSVAFGTVSASSTLVQSGGTSYTVASTSLNAADFVSVANITAATITADTTNSGRFIFDQATGTLFFDANGNTTATAGVYAGCADDFVVATLVGPVVITASDFAFA